MALSYSNIVGYGSHLLLKRVNLPLKYMKEQQSVDSVESFKSKVFGFGGFIDLSSQKGHFFSSLQYGVDNDMKVLHLTPILTDEVTSLSVQFQSIEIHLPHPIIAKGMCEILFVALTSDKEPYIVIDLIDESYLLITLKIELSDFLVGNLTNRLVLDSFNDWVNISVPYSFELRSSPFFMKSLDEKNLIISMKDGGLLHFSRISALSAVDIFNFAESSAFLSLSLSGILGLNKSDIVVDGISCNAVVDIARISNNEFATLSVSKGLKVWNIESHKQVQNTTELEGPDQNFSWLTSIPSRYMQVHNIDSARYLSVVYTVENEVETSSGYVFKSFKITDSYISASANLTFSPDKPPSTLNGGVNAFKIQDFHIQEAEDRSVVKYFVLWKSGSYSILMRYNFNTVTSVVTGVFPSISQPISLSEELNLRRGDSYFENLIFNSGSFDDSIVKTALTIFKSKSGQNCSGLGDPSLRQEVRRTISHTSNMIGVSTASLWYKLFLICEEFRKISRESLALQVTPTYVLTCEVNGVGVYREAHLYEEFGQTTEADEFASFLTSLSSALSSNTKKKLMDEIRGIDKVDSQVATRLASCYLSSKIPEDEVAKIMDEMGEIPDAVDTINRLIGRGFNEEVILDEMSGVRSGEGFGLFSILITASIFKSIKSSHETILLNLFILLLLCEPNDSILTFLDAIVQKFSRYALFDVIFDVCFKSLSSRSGIEQDGVSSPENSIFWAAVVNKYPELLCLIKRKDYNGAFDYYSEIVLKSHNEQIVLNVVLDLLNRNEAKIINEKFSQALQISNPLNKFLSGLVCLYDDKPSQFFTEMADYEAFRAIDTEETKQLLLSGLHSHQQLKSFLSSIFSRPLGDILAHANYFHELAQLSKSFFKLSGSVIANPDSQPNFIKESFKFEKKAVQILNDAPIQDTGVIALKTLFLRNLFEESLEIPDLSESISSLEKLSPLISQGELKTFFTSLVKTLISKREISRIFKFRENELFVRHYLLVDGILLEIANNDLILSNALKCYEFLYSWRLFGSSNNGSSDSGDKRGAVESLYIFITRFRLEQENLVLASEESEDFKQFKLKVLELYMVIINCLKTFEDTDDMWFIKRDTSERLGVIKLKELTIEYYKWLKELERDLGNSIV